jgi:ER-bound oxygenase mpaB/B'/Rubber oxygenase, catalytic domain
MLNQRDHSTGHEPAGANRRPRSRHFSDLNQPAPRRHFHPSARPGGCNFVGPCAVSSVDHDLDAITFHTVNDPLSRAISLGARRTRCSFVVAGGSDAQTQLSFDDQRPLERRITGVARSCRRCRMGVTQALSRHRGRRYERRDAMRQRDPDTDYQEIYRQLATLEFPWDIYQALSFALFRTYAVPSIGQLLHRTGEFTARVQKRYDDTVLILDAVLEYGFDHPTGRAAIRRMNQMHGAYPISNDDLRYVLAAFVVVPVRWLRAYGWRELTDVELRASVAYYRRLGTLMGIHDIPGDLAGFERLLDEYEAARFQHDDSSRLIADATLELMATFPAQRTLPASWVRKGAYALMDPHLLDAFGYPPPDSRLVARVHGALRARGALVRRLPPRRRPAYASRRRDIRSYRPGYDVAALGTFPPRADHMDEFSR